MAFAVHRARFRRRRNRVGRQFPARKTLDDISDLELLDYRLPRDSIQELIAGFAASGRGNVSLRGHAISAETQVLVALRWFAKGGILSETAKIHGVSRSSASRIVRKVAEYLCDISPEHIYFPQEGRDLNDVVAKFWQKYNMPNTVGAVDGSHIRIQGPKHEEWVYVNRKHDHSLNVQIVCDSDLLILDLDAMWPGQNHDAFVLHMSNLPELFESGALGANWLLGDSGYPCKEWLMTPLLNPSTCAEKRYNRCQKAARAAVERCLGVLKSRFRCLHKSTGIIQLEPGTTSKVIVACAVLHNICRRRNVPLPDDIEDEDPLDQQQDYRDGNGGLRTRANLIAEYFN